MWMLVSAVATASLLGSTHCVGMCGPLALWAAGTTDASRSQVVLNTMLYHLGRLVTYAAVGCLAGMIGGLVEVGGNSIGLRMAAARLVGIAMILIGLWRLANLFWPSLAGPTKPIAQEPSWISKQLVRLRPQISRMPVALRATSVGLLTALLPCGWLYLFAFVAAGTADLISGAMVMAAFWIGTLPLLTGLIASASFLKQRFRTAIPAIASLLLIVTGYYTATNNAFANTESFRMLEASAKTDTALLQSEPLPCCRSVDDRANP